MTSTKKVSDNNSGPLTRSRSTGKLNMSGLVKKRTHNGSKATRSAVNSTKFVHNPSGVSSEAPSQLKRNSNVLRKVTSSVIKEPSSRRRSRENALIQETTSPVSTSIHKPSLNLESSPTSKTASQSLNLESSPILSKSAPRSTAQNGTSLKTSVVVKSNAKTATHSLKFPALKNQNSSYERSGEINGESEHVTGSFRQDKVCSSCKQKQRQLELLSSQYGELKTKCSREETLVNELMSTSNRNTKVISTLEKQNMALSAKINALENSRPLSKKLARRGTTNDILSCEKEKRICQLSQAELMTDTRGIVEEFIPVLLAVRAGVHKACYSEMTESIFQVTKSNGSQRIRDWKGKFESVSGIEPSIVGNPMLKISEDSDEKTVPKCPLAISTSVDFFQPSGRYPYSMIKDACWKLVTSKECFSSHRSSSNWSRLTSALERDQVTSSLFQKTLHSKLSNHKRTCKTLFFKSLGYEKLFTSNTCDRDRRNEEKLEAWMKLVQGISFAAKERLRNTNAIIEDPSIKSIDCSFWRTAEWEQIRRDNSDKNEPPFDQVSMHDSIDLLFQNNAARLAYISLTGYAPSENESLITVARADSWFTTCALLINLPDGKGGRRNAIFQELFSLLFPIAVRNILAGIRSMVKSAYPSELEIMSMSQANEDNENWFDSSFRPNERSATNVVFMPSKRKYYVYVTKTWFTSNICSWIPIIDAYVGTACKGDNYFHELTLEEKNEDDEMGLISSMEQNKPSDSESYPQVNTNPSSILNSPEVLAPLTVPAMPKSKLKRGNRETYSSRTPFGRTEKRFKANADNPGLEENILVSKDVDEILDSDEAIEETPYMNDTQECTAIDDLIHDSQTYEEEEEDEESY